MPGCGMVMGMSIVARGLFVAGVVLLAVGGLRLRPGHTSRAERAPVKQAMAAPVTAVRLASAYVVRGAGDKGSNGVYRLAGRWHGQPCYRKRGRVLWRKVPDAWCIGSEQGIRTYMAGGDIAGPNAGTWFTVSGKAPAPTVTAVKTS